MNARSDVTGVIQPLQTGLVEDEKDRSRRVEVLNRAVEVVRKQIPADILNTQHKGELEFELEVDSPRQSNSLFPLNELVMLIEQRANQSNLRSAAWKRASLCLVGLPCLESSIHAH